MNILFCSDGFSTGRRALSDALPGHTVLSCHASEIKESLVNVDVLVPGVSIIDREVMEAGQFGMIHQFGRGLDGVDIPAATENGVWVANVPAGEFGNADSVAEHAVMFMLALSRRLPEMKGALNARLVSEPSGRSLLKKTVCIIGLGAIGVETARRLKSFQMRVLAIRRQPELGAPEDAGVESVHGMEDLPAILEQSDYVILCTPYRPELRCLINRDTLSHFKPGAFLINVGRGGLVDDEALAEALNSGHLAGAGLDVFWEEPVDPNHPLLQCNVIATPHVAGITDTACAALATALAENIRRYELGEAPQNAANAPISPRGPLRPLALL
jgi:phosphoglycerate dehydrogenase-like enzyme